MNYRITALLLLAFAISFFLSGSFAVAQNTTTDQENSFVFLEENGTVYRPSSNRAWSYFVGSYDDLSVAIETCKLCQRKHKNGAREFAKMQRSLEKKKAAQQKSIQQHFQKYQSRLENLTFTRTDDGRMIADQPDSLVPFHQTKEIQKILKSSPTRHESWIATEVKKLSTINKELFHVEQMRFLGTSIGIANSLRSKTFQSVTQIDNSRLTKLEEERQKSIKQFVQNRKNDRRQAFDELIDVLTSRQIQKLEKRLGVKKEFFFDFMNYYTSDHFDRHLSANIHYQLMISRRNRKKYVGIEGLETLNGKIGENVVVRYHVSEAKPLSNLSAIQREANIDYTKLIETGSPINQFNFAYFSQPIRWNRSSPIWLLEPSPEQERGLSEALSGWRHRSSSTSLKEKIENNNRFFEEMSLVANPRQGLGFFRAIFRYHGPVAFFFLPGVKKEYRLSDQQLAKILDIADFELEKSMEEKKAFAKIELKLLKEHLTDAEIRKLSNAMDVSVENAVRQRVNQFVEDGLSPFFTDGGKQPFQLMVPIH